LQENALRNAADKDLGVLRVDRGPLGVEGIDYDVVPLTLILRARVGEEDEADGLAVAVLCVGAREPDWRMCEVREGAGGKEGIGTD
jgi:hypothetical protein